MEELFWSFARVREMLQARQIVVPARFLTKLTVEQFNALGDWLWYECHPTEIRSKRHCLPPKFMDAYLHNYPSQSLLPRKGKRDKKT